MKHAPDSANDNVAAYGAAVSQAYESGRLALGCRDNSAGCGDVGGAVLMAEAECARALRGEEYGVAVLPRVGTALVFWSVHRDGTADREMWHTGCIPRAVSTGSSGRWVMSKFKSPPPEEQQEATCSTTAK